VPTERLDLLLNALAMQKVTSTRGGKPQGVVAPHASIS
jgi:hypothetical protein